MSVHGLQPEEFLSFVHDIDVSAVMANETLGQLITRLPGRKYIFTNGSVAHAENVTRQLGIDHVFDGMFDIVTAAYEPKPKRQAYERMIERAGIEPSRASMFEDMARNLEAPHLLGMTTVWVRPSLLGPERHHQIAHEGADGPHIHHITDDLDSFLHALLPPHEA